jgi:hypothetical protein
MTPNKQELGILNLIEKKLVNFSEVIVCLFENCNLSCVFCPQKHDSVVGMSRDEILSKIQITTNYIKSVSTNEIHIHIMGGELFQDHLIEKGFLETYSEFIIDLKEQLKDSGKSLHFNFISNLVLTRKKELKEFLLKHDLDISASYDPSGRFDNKSLELFENNLNFFSDRIKMVSCVLTSPNIKRIIAGDLTFDEIYKKFPVDWDSLIPAVELSPVLMPKESELLEFYKLLIDRYPLCINMESFIEKKAQFRMRCTRGKSLTIMPNNSIPKGCSGATFLSESESKAPETHKIVENFLAKYDCLCCEYYSRCQFTCFIKQDYKKLVRDIEACVFKETFKYADKVLSEAASVDKKENEAHTVIETR